jgi:uncharacterized membrane protein YqiK
MHKFEDDEKETPGDLSAQYSVIEEQIAVLMTARAVYNLKVMVKANNVDMPLAKAIRLVGGAGRLEKLWRAPTKKKVDRWDREQRLERDKDHEFATQVISIEDCLKAARIEGKRASSLREAIAVGNGAGLEMELDPGLFE